MKPEFSVVKEFLLSWGLAPFQEPDTDHIGVGDEYHINSSCYAKMCDEAVVAHGDEFRKYLSSVIYATDGAFYISGADRWADMEADYNS